MKKRISILGSTGSIGKQTLDVVDMHPERFEVEALAAGRNMELLMQQIRRYRPKIVSVASPEDAKRIRDEFSGAVEVDYGEKGLIAAASENDADVVVTALVGSAGLRPTLAAIQAGKTIALANKETLVAAGRIVTGEAAKRGVPIVPVDSEHSAIFQCLNGEAAKGIETLIITASGGSFRDLSRDQLRGVTVEQALRHPNWSMGAKITIDSATMVNKGLEVIEARWLFGVPYSKIRVLLHPESIIHSMVEFVDRSVIAQLGHPDMRVPIQYALSYPERLANNTRPLRLEEIGSLHFRPMDFERFPCLRMAFESGKAGGTYPAVFNAANEVAVARFLKREIEFLRIESMIEETLQKHHPVSEPELEDILAADAWARRQAEALAP